MVRQRKAVGRFRRLEVAYIFICLCFENVAGIPTTIASGHLVKAQSSLQPQNLDKKETNNHSPQNGDEEMSFNLIRKSRELPQLSEEENIFEKLSDENVVVSQSKRSKGTLIPFPRLGRSKAFDANSIMPYPDSWIIPYIRKNQETFDEIDKSVFDDLPADDEQASEYFNDSVEENGGDSSGDNEINVSAEDVRESSLSLETASEFGSPNSITERQANDNGTVIPYPRFGKRYENVVRYTNNDSVVRNKRTSDSLIPQIRYGRSALPEKQPKEQKLPFYILPNYRPGRSTSESINLFKFDKFPKQGMLPYPRPGRSNMGVGKRQDYILPVPRFGRSTEDRAKLDKLTVELLMQLSPTMRDGMTKELEEELIKSEESPTFLIPYPRPGKRFFGTKPLPPNVKFEVKGKDLSLEEFKEREPITPTIFVVPYPRPGRSNSDKRGNNFLIPYARAGRSVPTSMVPYPRLGRFVKKGNQFYILPYPRAGRSDSNASLVPYPRFGKSDYSILPYPRFGKSTNSILPYPRLGRSENKITQSQSSGIGHILPYPRFGRTAFSGSMIPQLRVGKSSDYQPNLTQQDFQFNGYSNDDQRKVESEQISSKLEKDTKFKSALLVPAKKLRKHMLTIDSSYMLPYPRPGRFA